MKLQRLNQEKVGGVPKYYTVRLVERGKKQWRATRGAQFLMGRVLPIPKKKNGRRSMWALRIFSSFPKGQDVVVSYQLKGVSVCELGNNCRNLKIPGYGRQNLSGGGIKSRKFFFPRGGKIKKRKTVGRGPFRRSTSGRGGAGIHTSCKARGS